MDGRRKIVDVQFYKSDAGRIPVREWLKSLSPEDRKTIGEDMRTVEFGWPLGMPLVKKLDANLWEVRSSLSDNRAARILFMLYGNMMILLHGFIKKTAKTTRKDLNTAKKRMSFIEKGK